MHFWVDLNLRRLAFQGSFESEKANILGFIWARDESLLGSTWARAASLLTPKGWPFQVKSDPKMLAFLPPKTSLNGQKNRKTPDNIGIQRGARPDNQTRPTKTKMNTNQTKPNRVKPNIIPKSKALRKTETQASTNSLCACRKTPFPKRQYSRILINLRLVTQLA